MRNAAPESALAHSLLDGLHGIEIGGSSGNQFGLDVLNVDLTDSMEAFYKQEEIKMFGEARPVDVVAEASTLPFPSGSKDFVLASHVLEHTPDPIKALEEWWRVIRPGGFVYLIVPHKERTFDKDRPRTPLAELILRHQGVNCPVGDAHHSVWITEDVLELIAYLKMPVVAVQDADDKIGNGFTVVLRKGTEGCSV